MALTVAWSSHAVAWLLLEAGSLRDKLVVVNLSGRGDEDLGIVAGAGDAAEQGR